MGDMSQLGNHTVAMCHMKLVADRAPLYNVVRTNITTLIEWRAAAILLCRVPFPRHYYVIAKRVLHAEGKSESRIALHDAGTATTWAPKLV